MESCYVSLKKRKWVNRGFLRGPFLPIYGSGALMMLLVSMPFQDNIVLTYFAGVLGATALEYVTGAVMEKMFQVRYWDYSSKKFNYKGHICLSSSIAWGFYTIAMTEVIHKPIEEMMYMIPANILAIITLIVTVVFWIDFSISFMAALDIRDILVKMESAKGEMERMQKRLDVIIAFTTEDFANKKEAFEDNLAQKKDNLTQSIEKGFDEWKNGVGDRLESLKSLSQSKAGSHLENFKDEIIDIRVKYGKISESTSGYLTGVRDRIKRELIRSNPGMTSSKYKESLEELKAKVSNWRK